MKELLKQIIFEQQEYCKNIAQDTVPRDYRGRVAYHNGDTNYYWYKTLWKVCFASANAQQIAGARLLFQF